jgi:predicted nucleotidyltransferase
MELETIIEDLKEIGNKLLSKTNTINCYLFGSILTNPKSANDIDILIIYKNKDQLSIIKQEFKIFSTQNPIHMIYFTYSEEHELNFINQQKAREVFSL